MAEDLVVTPGLIVPRSELAWTAVRASGPGGQNVNKVATRVELRFDLANSSLPQDLLARLSKLCQGRLDAVGRVVIRCDATRYQARNLELARAQLAELIRLASVVPKRRRPSKPSQAAKARRVDAKRRAGAKKQARRGDAFD